MSFAKSTGPLFIKFKGKAKTKFFSLVLWSSGHRRLKFFTFKIWIRRNGYDLRDLKMVILFLKAEPLAKIWENVILSQRAALVIKWQLNSGGSRLARDNFADGLKKIFSPLRGNQNILGPPLKPVKFWAGSAPEREDEARSILLFLILRRPPQQ